LNYTSEIAAIARLRCELHDVPNIVGPAYGARLCDKAFAVKNALFRLELRMAHADKCRRKLPRDQKPQCYWSTSLLKLYVNLANRRPRRPSQQESAPARQSSPQTPRHPTLRTR